MSKPYNTSPCIPETLKALIETLPSETQAALRAELGRIDAVRVAMDAVGQLAGFLPPVRRMLPVVPIICPGIFDTDTDRTFRMAVEEWFAPEWPEHPSHVLVAGHHPEPGNDDRLAPERLQSFLDARLSGIVVKSQVQAANAPAQAAWIVEQIQGLGLTTVALRTHPSHMARLFMTVLRELEKMGLEREVVLLPWWRPYDPYQEYRLTEPWGSWYSNATLLAGEAKRICDYAPRDVASAAEVKAYFDWLFRQSPAAAVLRMASGL